MRVKRFPSRPLTSIVQQTATASVRSVFADLVAGNPVDFKTNGLPSSFDFDGVEVDWDKPVVREAPNKILQFLHKDKYIPGLNVAVEE